MSVEFTDTTDQQALAAELTAFVNDNWGAFRAMAGASKDDDVLVAWMKQRHFVCHAKPRQELIDQDPDAAPQAAKAGPLELSAGAVYTRWIVVCCPNDAGGFQIAWLYASFYPEAQA